MLIFKNALLDFFRPILSLNIFFCGNTCDFICEAMKQTLIETVYSCVKYAHYKETWAIEKKINKYLFLHNTTDIW